MSSDRGRKLENLKIRMDPETLKLNHLATMALYLSVKLFNLSVFKRIRRSDRSPNICLGVVAYFLFIYLYIFWDTNFSLGIFSLGPGDKIHHCTNSIAEKHIV